MFTGVVPQGTAFRRVAEVANDYSYLDELIDLMLRQDPAQRPTIGEIKQALIARGNEFLAAQRLNSLKSEVIPETEVDDPFIRNPLRIIATDYRNGYLIFTLSAMPPPMWMQAFHNPQGSWGALLGSGPEYFQFRGTEAHVPISESADPQQVVNYAKSYVENVNRQYAERVLENNRQVIAAERADLKRKIAAEEQRNKVLARLRGEH